MSVNWELSYFRIESNDVALYANGKMQVAVYVLISAKDTRTEKIYEMTKDELARIQLMDYYSKVPVVGDWFYTSKPNDLAHGMPGKARIAKGDGHDASSEPPEPSRQQKKYWVSTINIESKSIGARILLPNNQWADTRHGSYDSHVVLRGHEPVRYTLNNTEFKKYDTAGGHDWDQDNYYLSSKVYPFVGNTIRGFRNDKYPIVGMRMANGFWFANGNKRYIHYIWPMGDSTRLVAGLTHSEDGKVLHPPSVQTITVRERRNEMCFTRLEIKLGHNFNIYKKPWHFFPTHFWVWDIYGNKGEFWMDEGSDPNQLKVIDHAPEGVSDDAVEELTEAQDEQGVPEEEDAPRATW